jgi:hypothetical protein
MNNLLHCEACVYRQRRRADARCEVDGSRCIANAAAGLCPHPEGSRFVLPPPARSRGETITVPDPARGDAAGRKKWAEMHARAMAWNPAAGDAAAEAAYLARAADGLAGCQCSPHWRAYLKSHPPDLSSAESYFAWTVAAHNAVNARLGKPPLDFRTAASRWAGSTAAPL